MWPFLKVFSRRVALFLGIAGICTYVVMAGSSPAVVRAGVMGAITLLSYVFGRPSEAKRLLWVASFLMLFVSPYLIADVGFQLSVAATAGILYIEPLLRHTVFGLHAPRRWYQVYLSNYLFPSLAASLFTLPIILWYFGRISWISPFVNMLILPVVPLIMLLSALAIILSIIPILGKIALLVLYVPLYFVVEVIYLFR
jgi:competence protein ComEC